MRKLHRLHNKRFGDWLSMRVLIAGCLILGGLLITPWLFAVALAYVLLLRWMYPLPAWHKEGQKLLDAMLFEDAEKIYRDAVGHLEEHGPVDLLGDAYWCLAEALELREAHAEANDYYGRALEIIESHYGPQDNYVGMILSRLCECAVKLNRFDEVEKHFETMQSRGFLAGRRFKIRRARALICLSACYRAKGDRARSKQTTIEAVETFEQCTPNLTEFYDFACFSAFRLFAEEPIEGAAALYRRILAVDKHKTITLDDVPTRKVNITDSYHGINVRDPYRWLEDGDSKEVRKWVEQKTDRATYYFSRMTGRYPLCSRVDSHKLDNIRDLPVKAGGRYFVALHDRKNVDFSLHSLPSLDDTPTLVFDPNQHVEEGNSRVVGGILSPCGRYLAYNVSVAGSDWTEWRIHDLDMAVDLPEAIRWTFLGHVSWSTDSRGFFYTWMERPSEDSDVKSAVRFPSIRYHVVGTPQSEDRIIYERPDLPDLLVSTQTSSNGEYLFIYCQNPDEHGEGILLLPLEYDDSEPLELFEIGDSYYGCLDSKDNEKIYVLTDNQAPNYRIVSVDIREALSGNVTIEEVIAESDALVSAAHLIDEFILVLYQKAGESYVKKFDTNGKYQHRLDLPPNSTINLSTSEGDVFIEVIDPVSPSVHLQYDPKTESITEIYRIQPSFTADQYTLEKVSYESRDGTSIPMLISRRKDVPLDGDRPALLFGYGGFGIPVTPSFSIYTLAWMDLGGIYCMPSIRGGGDFGREWHKAGKGRNKQNSFDDFIAAAEWLIENRYTSPERLAAKGGSNGGLVVAVSIIQRPDLFRAASIDSGVLDMVRFSKFAMGWFAVNEYGSPDDRLDFEALYSYSPVHRIKPDIDYPATLITAGTNDTRLPPVHSYKFAAALSEAQASDRPILLCVDQDAGHTGPTRRTSKYLDELCFLAEQVGIDIISTLDNVSES